MSKKRNRRNRRKNKKKRKNLYFFKKNKIQKGAGFGAGAALGFLLPQILNTTGKILKINV